MLLPRWSQSIPTLLLACCTVSSFAKPIDAATAGIDSPNDTATTSHSTASTLANSYHTATGAPFSIKTYAALGDSYAAGMDAGEALGPTCFRYSDSYPAQLNRTGRLGSDHEFQFVACGGATMNDIGNQIEAVCKPDFATISIGGNDAGFFKILDACVYKFYSSFSSTCYERLEDATNFVTGTYFKKTYNEIMDGLLEKNDAPSFRIYATGYSPFFDDRLTDDCNNQSLGYWSVYQPKLTAGVRERVNNVTSRINEVIGQIIKDRDDDRIIFVNWAHRFDAHRFCQPGKRPEDGENTWFFDATFRSKPRGGGIRTDGWGNALGIGTARVFHPKPQGHSAIVEEILSISGLATAGGP